jgi:hypothetical protein
MAWSRLLRILTESALNFGGQYMKRTILLVLFTSTLLWAGKNKEDFPMRLQITTLAKRLTPSGGVFVQGKANLLDGDTSYAVDYNGTCDFSFQTYPTSAHISQPARWKKQPYEVEARWTKEGHEGDYNSCKLKVGVMLPHQAYITQAGGYKLVNCDKGPNCPAIWGAK